MSYQREIVRGRGATWFWIVRFNGLIVREGSTRDGREGAEQRAEVAEWCDRARGYNFCTACDQTIVEEKPTEHQWWCAGADGKATRLGRRNLNVRIGFSKR